MATLASVDLNLLVSLRALLRLRSVTRAAAEVKGDLAMGAVAAGLAAVVGFCGGLVAVWARVEAANVVTAPTKATRTNCFIRANLSGSPLYCNKRRKP